jgi:predicted nucleotidyltransferase
LAEKQIASAIAALERALSHFGRHMLIGGIAVIAYGVRRLTDDVDATLWADGVVLDDLFRRLDEESITPRIRDAVSFARRNQVLLLRHRGSGIDIDLSLAWLPFESAALDRADLLPIGRRRVRVVTPGDLIVYKAIAGRERDRSDIERLLEIHGSTVNLRRVRSTVAELANLLERPELVDDLDRIARAVRRRKRAAGQRPKRKVKAKARR